MKTANALAQEVFGIDWEEELEEASTTDLQRKAERLWKNQDLTLFRWSNFGTDSRSCASLYKSALRTAYSYLAELSNDVQLRNSAINEDEAKLRQEVGALEKDLQSLEECRKRLQAVDKLKRTCHNSLIKYLKVLSKKLTKILKIISLKKNINVQIL